MRTPAWLLLLTLSACGSPKDGGETATESAIAERAEEIRTAADADMNRQIAEIGEAANAESRAAPVEAANTQ